jgi:hypothetical protein
VAKNRELVFQRLLNAGVDGRLTTPLTRAKNLGPVSARELGRLGIHTLEHLRELGWQEAALLWVDRFPSRVNLNAFRSLIGAIYGVDWNRIPPEEEARARRLVDRLRRERANQGTA